MQEQQSLINHPLIEILNLQDDIREFFQELGQEILGNNIELSEVGISLIIGVTFASLEAMSGLFSKRISNRHADTINKILIMVLFISLVSLQRIIDKNNINSVSKIFVNSWIFFWISDFLDKKTYFSLNSIYKSFFLTLALSIRKPVSMILIVCGHFLAYKKVLKIFERIFNKIENVEIIKMLDVLGSSDTVFSALLEDGKSIFRKVSKEKVKFNHHCFKKEFFLETLTNEYANEVKQFLEANQFNFQGRISCKDPSTTFINVLLKHPSILKRDENNNQESCYIVN